MIRVLVVDDHPAVRETLAAFLDAQGEIQVTGIAANGREAVALCHADAPDVVVMDVRMPLLDGVAATRLIKARAPRTHVILLTAYEDDRIAAAGASVGVDRFATKGSSGAALVGHVLEVAETD